MKFDQRLYWLLDSCVTGPRRVRCLGASNNEEIFNMRSHGLEQAALIDALGCLFTEGYLRAAWSHGDLSETFLPSYEQLRNDLVGPTGAAGDRSQDEMVYFVSAMGGELWEGYSKPDWDRYVCDLYGADEYELISRSGAEMERYIEMIRWSEGVSVRRGSMRSDIVRPWQATYWKKWPDAQRVTFRPEKSGVARPEKEWPPELVQWWQEEPRWYTRWEG